MAARLNLVNATAALIDAAIEDAERLGRMLEARIADEWAGFPEALVAIRSAYAKSVVSDDWGTRFFVLDDPRTLIGMGGYKGPPSPDGVVEIGYAIAPAFRGQGLATEASRQLVERAFLDDRVVSVDAHTLAEPNASTRVLEKLRFERIGELHDPDEGPCWHYRRLRSTA